MAYLLRFLLLLMFLGMGFTTLIAHEPQLISFSHIKLAIPFFIFTIFIQAFVMFYFIGVSKLAQNVFQILKSGQNLNELFENPPLDLSPYQQKTERFVYESNLSKRQTIPWTVLMLLLGMIGFLLGGAHDTGMVEKTTHSGVIYGFAVAMLIGFFRQWHFLGRSHHLLRELKALFQISDHSM